MPLTSGTNVKVTVEDRVAVATIDHRPVNALDKQTMEELDRLAAEADGDEGVKVLILTGAGSLAFVAGADIKALSDITSGEEAARLSSMGQAVLLRLERLSKPVIAAINGICLGGGLELAMACHLRITGDRARFGQPEIGLGIVPGWGGTQRLPRLIGPAKAAEWILGGEVYSAQEALRLGLVNLVVPQDQVLKASKDFARKLAGKPGVALREALRLLQAAPHSALEAGLAKEAEAFGRTAATADCREGVRAFLEKRQPKFSDR
ncbi:MAG TPA: enoyl-CoA hydratase-related protein [bacterium]